ncbi:sensor histidine kinase [Lichenifustis flavocetrariae]|uniref:histidine kinase n=1 Tax=Lichenifustis flavocetrariae TaxID=2949735 RepID=A0AA42CJG1_9HYPH|nr:PAS domain-containing sensor histidine kinase [Lichenifustis flavocetrariae]MCW6509543.1 ATP-binding protein [Lichenifustis flavocetrariae]
MTAPLAANVLAEIFGTLAIDAVRPTETPLVIVAQHEARVVWANDGAVHLLGTANARDISDLLFGSGPSARTFARRLSHLSPEQGPTLERLRLSRDFPAVWETIACRALADLGPGPLVALQFPASPLAQPRRDDPFASALDHDPELPPEDATAAPPTHSGELEGPSSRQRILRVLWETDATGCLTAIDPVFQSAMGHAALRIDDHLPTRIRAFAPDLADRLDDSLRDHHSIETSRVSWPHSVTGDAVPVEIGCAPKRGRGAGLRGFCTLHVHGTVTRPASLPELIASIEPVQPANDDDAPGGTEPEVALVVDDAVHVPEPPASDIQPGAGSRAAMPTIVAGSSNIVHFPSMRIGSVPANFGHELRPALPPQVPPAGRGEALGIEPPRWSESPETDQATSSVFPSELTADEQDAFEHIRKVLGTRPFAHSPPAQEDLPEPAAPPPPVRAVTLDPSEVAGLIDVLPAALLLDMEGIRHANATLLARLGFSTQLDFQARQAAEEPGPEGRIRASDGTWVEARVEHVELGSSTARIWIVPDLVAKTPEQSIERSENEPSEAEPWSSTALAFAADGFALIDESGKLRQVSPQAARLFGYGAAELVGASGADLLMPNQDSSWHGLLAAAVETSNVVSNEVLGRTRSGQPIPLLVRLGRVAPDRLCVFWNDDASRKRAVNGLDAARREAERANALKSEFLAKVSHEIRTPLNAILGFAEVIRDERLGPVGNARYLDYLKDIHASGTHVMSLVNDLLDLSRIESGGMDLRLEAVDANSIVQACVNALQTQAHRERIIMRLSLAPRLPPTLADEHSLRQIVSNLLSNAVKFNEPGGQVIVSTTLAASDAITIRIRDTGVGMTEQEIESAMEPFHQVSSTKRSGSGLGLPLTKALVEANCASMSIRSTPGEGTLVEVVFPVVEQDSVSMPAE